MYQCTGTLGVVAKVPPYDLVTLGIFTSTVQNRRFLCTDLLHIPLKAVYQLDIIEGVPTSRETVRE